MRKISTPQIATFILMFGLISILSLVTTVFVIDTLPLGDFRGVILVASALMLYYLFAILVYRVMIRFFPLREGDFECGSKAEFIAQLHNLFHVVIFFSLIKTHFLPVPLMRLVYVALGAKLGENTYGGTFLDPAMTEIGSNCLIGHEAVLFAHVMEGGRFGLRRIRIGSDVTIGANAAIMPGVVIGNGATVSVGAVVRKGTVIPAGEVWGGIPARRLLSDGD